MKAPRPAPRDRLRGLSLAAIALLTASGMARADANLALDKGCMNCHGNPPRGKAPTLATLAQRYAALDEQALERKARALIEHSLIGGIPAHEKLTLEESQRLVRWIAAGAR
ncbi:MAG: c-type cytochrome [Pseudomonadota bacterium]